MVEERQGIKAVEGGRNSQRPMKSLKNTNTQVIYLVATFGKICTTLLTSGRTLLFVQHGINTIFF